MTRVHGTLLAGLAVGIVAPFAITMRAMATPDTPAVHLTFAFVVIPVVLLMLLTACYRFVFAAADPIVRSEVRQMLASGVAIFVLQISMTVIAAYATVEGAATGRELAGVAIGSVATLAIAGLIGRRVGVWRRPYDEWLSLDLGPA